MILINQLYYLLVLISQSCYFMILINQSCFVKILINQSRYFMILINQLHYLMVLINQSGYFMILINQSIYVLLNVMDCWSVLMKYFAIFSVAYNEWRGSAAVHYRRDCKSDVCGHTENYTASKVRLLLCLCVYLPCKDDLILQPCYNSRYSKSLWLANITSAL